MFRSSNKLGQLGAWEGIGPGRHNTWIDMTEEGTTKFVFKIYNPQRTISATITSNQDQITIQDTETKIIISSSDNPLPEFTKVNISKTSPTD